jgi:hypothetical protein
MPFSITMMDGIVLLAVLFAVVFSAAWLISPRLRVWIERPKYRFLANVQQADQRTYDVARQERTR